MRLGRKTKRELYDPPRLARRCVGQRLDDVVADVSGELAGVGVGDARVDRPNDRRPLFGRGGSMGATSSRSSRDVRSIAVSLAVHSHWM